MKITIEIDTKNIVELTEAVVLLTSFSTKMAQAEITPTSSKKPEPIPEPEKEEKVAKKTVKVTEKATETPKSTITLADLKERAKIKVQETDRETVKATISKYAPKLAEISPDDYEKLYKDLA